MPDSPVEDIGRVETRFFDFGPDLLPFRLACGETLPQVRLAYEMYGRLNEAKDNAVLVFHALSGSQHAAGFNPTVPGVGLLWTEECQTGWWDGFIGPGKVLDTRKYCVICVNILGGCYGSTGPSSPHPDTAPYGSRFPKIGFTDIVESQMRLLDHLGIQRLHGVIGASLGGMLSLVLATRFPDRVDTVVLFATGLKVSTLTRIHNYEQIYAIEQDPNFRGGNYYDGSRPDSGLALARSIAHKTYVSLQMLTDRARAEIRQADDSFSHYTFSHSIESYMHHQGKKFVQRFDANTYLRIVEAWQKFKLAEAVGKASVHEALQACRHQKCLVFSIDSDVCFYPEEQAILTQHLKDAGVPVQHITVHSDKGHDAFLIEPELFAPYLAFTLENRW